MQFGEIVIVLRGGHQFPQDKGSLRPILGVYVGARGHERFVRLLHDDPLDVSGWNKAGDIGHWSKSVVFPVPEVAIGLAWGALDSRANAWLRKVDRLHGRHERAKKLLAKIEGEGSA